MTPFVFFWILIAAVGVGLLLHLFSFFRAMRAASRSVGGDRSRQIGEGL